MPRRNNPEFPKRRPEIGAVAAEPRSPGAVAPELRKEDKKKQAQDAKRRRRIDSEVTRSCRKWRKASARFALDTSDPLASTDAPVWRDAGQSPPALPASTALIVAPPIDRAIQGTTSGNERGHPQRLLIAPPTEHAVQVLDALEMDPSEPSEDVAPRRRWWLFWRKAPVVDPRRERVKRHLPRRRSLLQKHDPTSAQRMRQEVAFPASRPRAAARLVIWIFMIVVFVVGDLLDRLFLPEQRGGKSRRQRGAERLRRAFERMGGTAIKIGQQAAMRLDLLPFEYADELSNMLDKVPAFPTEEAIAAIEAAAHKPLYELFDTFDPDPIGSASVSCVYQALRKDGRKVAVKVRRPGIGPLFMADCKALEWIFGVGEMLTLLRPGFSKNLIVEFRTMLIEELDFVKEARSGELFRRRAKKFKMRYVTAPKVHFDYSSEQVLVTDFVKGIWLSEMVNAVERKDEELLAVFRQLNITPKRIARRLLAVNQFFNMEGLLFHADPHPGNIVVQPDSKLVFIDFGACGAYTEKERVVWRRLLGSQVRDDVGEMVQCALAILEPLPPIDIDEFTKRLEAVFWQDLYAFRSKHAQWWERTSAHIWISFLSLAREYNISMNLNTLRMIRSTLLYDTIAARLYDKIDAYDIYQRYLVKAGARAQERVEKRARKLLTRGPPKPFWVQVEQLTALVDKVFYIARRTVDAPPHMFSALVAKSSYAFQMILRTFVSIVLPGAGVVGFYLVKHILFGTPAEAQSYGLDNAFSDLMQNRLFSIWAALIVLLNMRRVSQRLLDKEVD